MELSASIRTDLPLCRELYEILLLHPERSDFRLEFAKPHVGITDRYFINTEAARIEVVCFKPTLLSLFIEAHEYFKRYSATSASPTDVYFMTIALLLACPEHKTVLNEHERVFLQLLDKTPHKGSLIQKEFQIISRLLTCSNNRINKSSSLWCFFRKLFTITNDKFSTLEVNYLSVIWYSADIHASNYYAWNTARWFFGVVPQIQKKTILEQTRGFCHTHLKDASAWSAYQYMLLLDQKLDQVRSYELARYERKLEIPISQNFYPIYWIKSFRNDYIKELISLIDRLTVTSWPPFLCLLSLLVAKPKSDSENLISKWDKELVDFETVNSAIQLYRKHPIVPQKYINDVLLSRKIQCLGYKKRCIESWQRIYNK